MRSPSSPAWAALTAELDRWGEAGRCARFWWRDDDAAAPTPQLDRLLALADDTPLALAVIPAAAEPALAEVLRQRPEVCVVQHGWGHVNHAAAGRKCEYPAERAEAAVAAELTEGQARLQALFGGQATAMLAPPWNRFAECFMALLPACGIRAVSQMAPRRAAVPAGVAALDVDVDVVAWKRGGGFIGEAAALGRLTEALRERRCDPGAAAVGLLTHHLVMDDASADFVARFGGMVAAHPAACWTGVSALMGSA